MVRHMAIDRRRSIALVLVALIAALLPLVAASPAQGASPGDLIINEVMQNPFAVSDTNGEWFEIFNPTGSAIDIDGWTIKDLGTDTHTIGSSVSVPAGGYVVLGRNDNSGANGGVTVNYEYSTFFLSNSDDEIILLDGSLTEIDRIEYDGGPDWPDPSGESMSLEDSTTDSNVGANWCTSSTSFGAGDKGTPGSTNVCEIIPIYDVQSANHLSPFEGQRIVTAGVVTAVAFNGFYVQDPDGDGDDATSDGMFVFDTRSFKPAVGDMVRLLDFVEEFSQFSDLSITEMGFPSIQVVSSGNTLPVPSIIGRSGRVPPNVLVISPDKEPVDLQVANASSFDPETDGIDFYESLEGMLVTIEDAVAVSATRTFSPFSSELFTLANNGADVAPRDARTKRDGIELQPDPDNRGDQNPERVQVQFDGTLYPGSVPAVTVGDRLGDVTGVVGYSFGNFEVNATELVTPVSGGLQGETTKLDNKQNHVTVSSYNVLNLSPLSEDDNQRATLASQIVDDLGSPDVIALQEIQDNSGEVDDQVVEADETLQALVDAIAAAGGPDYEFFNVDPVDGTSGGVPGGNIRNAFLYNPDRVDLVDFVSLTVDELTDLGVTDPNAFFETRNPLVGTFAFNDLEFTIINNHLTSRFGSTPIFGAIQPFFQEGETAREAQAFTLNEVVDLLLGDGMDRVAVVGDLNTFQWTDDLAEFLPGTGPDRVLTNLINQLNDDNVYSFNFEGNSQELDHFFVTDALLPAKIDIVHVNVDFPRVDDTVGSDHEPLLVRLKIGSQGKGNG